MKTNHQIGRRIAQIMTSTAAISLMASGAMAQDQSDQDTEDTGAGALEEIIVTAQKREQSLQDVPASVKAITNQMLEDMGADDFVDYARTVPSLSFVDRGPGLNKIVIRGVSGNAGVGTVGIYIDDIPVTADFLTPDLKLFDVDRVEVLRGPQGTLYGEGSMGGTIKIVTAQPNPNTFSAKMEARYSNTKGGGDNLGLSGMVNVPLIKDKLAIRAVGYYRDEDGWIDNIALGVDNANDEKTFGGRISARLVASDRLEITTTIMTQDTRTGAEQIYNPALGDLVQSRGVEERLDDEFTQYNATIRYDAGWAEFVSSTSYFERTQPFTRDLPALAGALGLPLVSVVFGFENEVFTEELRITSTDDQRLKWMLGFFYKNRDDVSTSLVTGAPLGTLFTNDASNSFEQVAVFGDLTYDITDKLQVGAGLRWFDEKLQTDSVTTLIFTGFVPEILSESTSGDTVTPRFTLAYNFTPDVMGYGIVSKGFRSGGTNPTAIPGQPTTYESDSTWNYEAGIKSSLLDNRMTFNASWFYIDWNNMQVTDSIIPGIFFTSNAGQSHSTGFEVELAARLFEGFTVTASGGYNKAVLDEDALSEMGTAGDRVPYVPKYTFSIAGDYRVPLGDRFTGVLRADYSKVGNSYNAFSGNPFAEMQSRYDLANIRVGVEGESWSIYGFITNVGDKRAELRVVGGEIYPNEPRTIGVTVRANY